MRVRVVQAAAARTRPDVVREVLPRSHVHAHTGASGQGLLRLDRRASEGQHILLLLLHPRTRRVVGVLRGRCRAGDLLLLRGVYACLYSTRIYNRCVSIIHIVTCSGCEACSRA